MESEGRNVIGLAPGREDRWVLLTAHLDSWFQGAIDDGSGVAAVLSVARRLAGTRHRRGLVALLADGEELGLIGSSVFLRRLDELGLSLDRIDAIVELDMVSALGAYRGRAPEASTPFPRFIVETPGLEPEASVIEGALVSEDLVLPVGLAEVTVGIRTDARWFFHRGVPGLFLNVLTPLYHTPLDTLEWVDPDDLEHVVDGVTAAMEILLERDALPVTPHLPLELTLERVGGMVEVEVVLGEGVPATVIPGLKVFTDLGRLHALAPDPVPGSSPPRFRASVPVGPGLPVEVLATASAGLRGGDAWADLD